MNMDHVRFVVVWTLSPTIEVAASILGLKVRSVTRQANRMRAAGIPLKPLTDARYNPHKRGPRQGPLTNDERAHMAEHYSFARRVAWRACLSIELPPQLREDIAEGAAVEALLLTARRSTEPGFVPATVRGLVASAVKRQVWQQMRALLSRVRAETPAVETAKDRAPTPPQSVAAAEESAHQQAARDLIGALPDTSGRKESAATREYLSLRTKARELGIETTGTADDIRERLADYYRAQLAKSDRAERAPEPEQPVEQESGAARPYEMSDLIRQRRVHPPAPRSRAQLDAERFISVWYQSFTVAGVARKLGRSVRSVSSFVERLRRLGVPLKELPARPGPLVRAARALVASRN
jgi:hypothetical protein